MATMHERSIVVFGGTWFGGCRVVWHLHKAGFFVRIASRHPDRGHRLFGYNDPQLHGISTSLPISRLSSQWSSVALISTPSPGRLVERSRSPATPRINAMRELGPPANPRRSTGTTIPNSSESQIETEIDTCTQFRRHPWNLHPEPRAAPSGEAR